MYQSKVLPLDYLHVISLISTTGLAPCHQSNAPLLDYLPVTSPMFYHWTTTLSLVQYPPLDYHPVTCPIFCHWITTLLPVQSSTTGIPPCHYGSPISTTGLPPSLVVKCSTSGLPPCYQSKVPPLDYHPVIIPLFTTGLPCHLVTSPMSTSRLPPCHHSTPGTLTTTAICCIFLTCFFFCHSQHKFHQPELVAVVKYEWQ